MKRRSLWISLLSACMAVSVCAGLAVKENGNLKAKAAIADMTQVEEAIDCAMPLEAGKVKKIKAWGYYDSDEDGIGDVWAFQGDGTANGQPEIRFSTPGTDTTPSDTSRVYAPKAYDSISVEYNITNSGTGLAESSTTSYLLQILGATAGTGSPNQYYYHVPDITADGEWHTLTIDLNSAFSGGSNENLPMNVSTFDDINEIVCCWNFKIAQDFNGEVMFRNFTVVESSTETKYTSTHANIWNHGARSATGIYFRVDSNGAPTNDWNIKYTPKTADAIKMIRGNETKNVGNTGAETIVKCNDVDYYMESWAIGVNDHGWEIGDVYVLNGEFHNAANKATIVFEDVRLEIVDVVDGKPIVVKQVSKHTMETVARHRGGFGYADGILSGVHFVSPSNGALYDSDWRVEYAPVREDNVVITRNGVDTAIGIPATGCIVKFAEDGYYFKMDKWMIERFGVFPMQVGDVITIKGIFAHRESILVFPETTFTVYEGGVLYSTDTVADAGFAVDSTGVGPYFKTETENAAPFDTDHWTVEFAPFEVDNIKRIRGGETTNLGRFDSRQIIKFKATEYYLDNVDIQAGDIVVIEGLFHCRQNINDVMQWLPYVLNFKTSYFYVEEGKSLTQLNPTYILHDAEGNVLETSGALAYGTTLSEALDGATLDPVEKAAEEHYTYTFDKWTINGAEVDYNAEYEGEVHIYPTFTRTPVEYTATFKVGEDTVATIPYTVETESITAPEITATPDDGYVYVWENFELTPGGITVNAVQQAIEYNAVFKVDGEEVATVTYTVEDTEITAPAVPEKAGYTGAWEAYTLTIGGIEVNAEYTMNVYTITFVADDETVETLTFTVETIGEIALPAVPEKAGYTGAWDKAVEDIELEDTTITAVHTAIEYNAVFKADGEVVATVTYTVEDTEITAPAVPEKAGYTGAWEAYTLTIGGIEVNAEYTMNVYTITFVADDETVETLTFTVETIGEIALPAVPEKAGYTGAWDKAVEDIELEDTTITAVYTEIPDEPTSDPTSDPESGSEEESEKESEEVAGGCMGSVGATSVVSLLALAAVAIIKKRR